MSRLLGLGFGWLLIACVAFVLAALAVLAVLEEWDNDQ